jgi:peptidoglycan/LPS O-acetylase OafA/YrhL
MSSMKTNYRALTSLRFFAASAVVCFHYVPGIKTFGWLPMPVQHLIQRGSIALCFFFVLSGFVLATSYQGRAIDDSNVRRSFWLARFARLYPAYILAFLLFIPMALHKYVSHPAPGTEDTAHVTFIASGLLSFLLIQAWTRFSQPWNGPGWSLSVESFFYFLFPYIAFRIMRLRTTVVLWLCFSLWAGSLLIVYSHVTGRMSDQFYTNYVCYHPLFWTPCFLTGIAIQRFVAPWQRLRATTSSMVSGVAIAAILVACMMAPGKWGVFVITTGTLPLVAVLILACSHGSCRLVRYIGSSPFYELGEVSYITYILQSPLWHYVGRISSRLAYRNASFRQGTTPQFVLFFSILIGASFLVSRYVEKPARRWLVEKFTGPRREVSWSGAAVGSVQG